MKKFNRMIDDEICKALYNGSGIDILRVRKYIRMKMRQAFEAGRDYTDVSRYPEDGFYFEHEDFKTWFKKKYK